jgi:uncharacterized protein (DUF1810 family)
LKVDFPFGTVHKRDIMLAINSQLFPGMEDLVARISPDLIDSLDRFLAAQDPVWDTVLAELQAGQKSTHWMWFIFPQLRGLGRSAMAHYFGLADKAEAESYLQHTILGPRLETCCQLLLNTAGDNAREILGSPDDLKLQSCMTLFSDIDAAPDVFDAILAKFYNGTRDQKTQALCRG